ALELEPENVSVLGAAGVLLMNLGRVDDSVRMNRYCVAHDPANAGAHNNLAAALYAASQWDAAIDSFRTAIRLTPHAAGMHQGVGIGLLLGKHDAAGALKECEAEVDEPSRIQCSALALHALGRTKEADAAQQALVEKYGADQAEYVATVFAF